MNKSILAACAVVSMAGSAEAQFTLLTFGQAPDLSMSTSSGSLRFDEGTTSSGGYTSLWSGEQMMVTGAPSAWASSRALINNSSWFGLDPSGPDGFYSLGGTPSNNRPLWNNDPGNNAIAGFTAAARFTGPILVGAGDGDDQISAIMASEIGWGYNAFRLAGNVNGPAGAGVISTISGNTGNPTLNSVHNLFVGRFTTSDPIASLTGLLTVSFLDAGGGTHFNVNLDLDGSARFDLRFYQVRDGDSINLFLGNVPAPSVVGVMGLAGVVTLHRRRR